MKIHDRHIAWIVPAALMFCAFGMAVVFAPREARSVSCEVTVFENQWESHVAVGRGRIWE